MRRLLCVLVFFSLFAGAAVARAQDDADKQTDAEGCKDSPLVTRMPGSLITSCDHKDFDQVDLPTSKDANGNEVDKTYEGAIDHWSYGGREGESALQEYRNFDAALRAAGFKMVYEGSPDNGKVMANKGNTYLLVDCGGGYYDITIVTVQAMKQEVSADATSLADSIAQTGRVTVYGINFETGKATIQPSSDGVLQQILLLLKNQPDLMLLVEGYTDNVGAAAANQVLSENRAKAVVAWLVAHGVDGSRLTAKGFGAMNPVADNSTEDGRAKNRRVELVKM